MMGMSLQLSQRCILNCSACGKPMDEHTPKDCPAKALDELYDAEPIIKCPKCKKGKVYLNSGDFYECMKCHRQYTHGFVGAPEGAEELILIDWRADRAIPVRLMPAKGSGQRAIAGRERLLKQLIRDERALRKKRKKK